MYNMTGKRYVSGSEQQREEAGITHISWPLFFLAVDNVADVFQIKLCLAAPTTLPLSRNKQGVKKACSVPSTFDTKSTMGGGASTKTPYSIANRTLVPSCYRRPYKNRQNPGYSQLRQFSTKHQPTASHHASLLHSSSLSAINPALTLDLLLAAAAGRTSSSSSSSFSSASPS